MINSIRHPFTVYYNDEPHSLGEREKKIIAGVTIAAAFTIVLIPFVFLISSAYFRHEALKELRRTESNEWTAETHKDTLKWLNEEVFHMEEKLPQFLKNSDVLASYAGVLFPTCEYHFENTKETIKVSVIKSRLLVEPEQFKEKVLDSLTSSQKNSLRDLEVEFTEECTGGLSLLVLTFSKSNS